MTSSDSSSDEDIARFAGVAVDASQLQAAAERSAQASGRGSSWAPSSTPLSSYTARSSCRLTWSVQFVQHSGVQEEEVCMAVGAAAPALQPKAAIRTAGAACSMQRS